MRRRLPASASDASREALSNSKQRVAPPLPPDLHDACIRWCEIQELCTKVKATTRNALRSISRKPPPPVASSRRTTKCGRFGLNTGFEVRYTLPALTDLEAILGYIERESPQGAARVQNRIQAIIDLLLLHPLVGAAKGAGFRSLAANRFFATSAIWNVTKLGT
jgi:plasmid stabilization system protein ParE